MTDRVIYKTVTVAAVDTVNSTFTAQLPDGQQLGPIESNPQNLPDVGQTVTLAVSGATPLYVPAGIAVNAVGDREVSAMSAGLLSSDTVTANLTLASQILTATSGQRSGLTPIGVQAWNASNVLTVNLDGVSNLLTGITQTAPAGQRRVVIGAAGSTGRIQLIAPNGADNEIASYSEGGVEAIRLSSPVEDTHATWNSVQFQSNEKGSISSGEMVVTYGGDTGGGKFFGVYEASNSGSPGVLPSRAERFYMSANRTTLRSQSTDTNFDMSTGLLSMHVGATSSQGEITVTPHGVADARSRSPRLRFVGENSVGSHFLKFVQESGGTSPRIEVTNDPDSGYGNIWAADFNIPSSETLKEQIADVPVDTALDKLRAMRVRSWRRRMDDGQLGPLEYGLVAEEAPAEVVVGDAQAISLRSQLAMTVAGLQRVFTILDNARTRVVALEGQVQTLNSRLAALEARLP